MYYLLPHALSLNIFFDHLMSFDEQGISSVITYIPALFKEDFANWIGIPGELLQADGFPLPTDNIYKMVETILEINEDWTWL